MAKFEYLENKKNFVDEIKSFFNSFWRAIIWKKDKWWTQALKQQGMEKFENACFVFKLL